MPVHLFVPCPLVLHSLVSLHSLTHANVNSSLADTFQTFVVCILHSPLLLGLYTCSFLGLKYLCKLIF